MLHGDSPQRRAVGTSDASPSLQLADSERRFHQLAESELELESDGYGAAPPARVPRFAAEARFESLCVHCSAAVAVKWSRCAAIQQAG